MIETIMDNNYFVKSRVNRFDAPPTSPPAPGRLHATTSIENLLDSLKSTIDQYRKQLDAPRLAKSIAEDDEDINDVLDHVETETFDVNSSRLCNNSCLSRRKGRGRWNLNSLGLFDSDSGYDFTEGCSTPSFLHSQSVVERSRDSGIIDDLKAERLQACFFENNKCTGDSFVSQKLPSSEIPPASAVNNEELVTGTPEIRVADYNVVSQYDNNFVVPLRSKPRLNQSETQERISAARSSESLLQLNALLRRSRSSIGSRTSLERRSRSSLLSAADSRSSRGSGLFEDLWSEFEVLFDDLKKGRRVSRGLSFEAVDSNSTDLDDSRVKSEATVRASCKTALKPDTVSTAECELTCHRPCRSRLGLACSPPSTSATGLEGSGVWPPRTHRLETSLDSPSQESITVHSSTRSRLVYKQPEDRLGHPTDDLFDEHAHFITSGHTHLTTQNPDEALCSRLQHFSELNPDYKLELDEDRKSFSGVVHVSLCLVRPVSLNGTLSSDNSRDKDVSESFYLPRNTTKPIYIDSTTTTEEFIRSFLQKYHIQDDHRKFVLYEQNVNADQDTVDSTLDESAWLRRLSPDEQPLQMVLNWGCSGQLPRRRLVLQENDHMEVMWDLFSVPELENFLMILRLEQQEHESEVRQSYELYRQALLDSMNKQAQDNVPKLIAPIDHRDNKISRVTSLNLSPNLIEPNESDC